MGSTPLRRSAAGSVLVAVAILASAVHPSAASTTWEIGDVFAGVGGGSYRVFDSAGNVKETISDGLGGYTTGCAFNPALDRIYTTNFSNNTVVAYDDASPHEDVQSISTSSTGGAANESVVFDSAGNFFVGHASGNANVYKFDAAGNQIGQFAVSTENVGSDWLDLAADQTTLFHTSEGRTIFRYDTASSTQLESFTTITEPGQAFALRLLPPGDGSGGLLAADRLDIKRLDGSGSVVKTYDVPSEDFWFALNLDPNGTSFWSGSPASGNIYRFGIESGAVEVGPIASGSGELYGLCVKGEPTAPCFEDGLAILKETPAEGVASGAVHRTAEPVVDDLNPDLRDAVHEVNCSVVVPVENAIDEITG